MFNWLKQQTPLPPFSAANPGKGSSIRVGFSNAQRNWTEEADSVVALASELESRGMRFAREDGRLEFNNGLIVRPQFVKLQPRDDGLVHTITTIEINHHSLCPRGTFEYQHSVGPSVEDSLRKGFAKWADTDLPVFMDALQEKAEHCTEMVKNIPASASDPARSRQIIFGPPLHGASREVFETGNAHDFCPCCLLTNCLEAFTDQLHDDGFYAIRLFATRNQQGAAQADCRVNGVDWAPGAAALLKYITTWPDRGLEYRKQLVVIRPLPAPKAAANP